MTAAAWGAWPVLPIVAAIAAALTWLTVEADKWADRRAARDTRAMDAWRAGMLRLQRAWEELR